MKNKAPYCTILFLFVFNFSFAQTNDYPHYANKELLIHCTLVDANADQIDIFFPVNIAYNKENIFTVITTSDLWQWTRGDDTSRRVQLIKILKGVLVNNDTLKVYSRDSFNEYKKYEIDTAFYHTLLRSDIKTILEKYIYHYALALYKLNEKQQRTVIYYLWQYNIPIHIASSPVGEIFGIGVHPLFPDYLFTNDLLNIPPFGKLW